MTPMFKEIRLKSRLGDPEKGSGAVTKTVIWIVVKAEQANTVTIVMLLLRGQLLAASRPCSKLQVKVVVEKCNLQNEIRLELTEGETGCWHQDTNQALLQLVSRMKLLVI